MTLRVKPLNNVGIGEMMRMMPIIEISRVEILEDESVVSFFPDEWDDADNVRLIDSIINGIPIGTIYLMHQHSKVIGPSGWSYEYKLLDGYYRLNAISNFMNGTFSLPDTFEFTESEFVDLRGMTFKDIKENYSGIAQRFLDHHVDVQVVDASRKAEIYRMFERLRIDHHCFW